LNDQKNDIELNKKDHENKKRIYNTLLRKLKETENELENIKISYNKEANKLRELKQEITILRNKDYSNKVIKENMHNEFNKNITYKNGLVPKIEELTYTYEESMKRIAEERKDILKENTIRSKMLMGSVVLQILNERRLKNLRSALENIKSEGSVKHLMLSKIIKLSLLKDNYMKRVKNLKFSKWKYKAINYTREYYINLKLLHKSLRTKTLVKYFHKWINNFNKQKILINNYLKTAKHLIELKELILTKELRHYFNKWYKVLNNDSLKNTLLKRVLMRAHKYLIRDSLSQWLFALGIIKEKEKFNELTKVMAVIKFKREMFNRFRNSVYVQEDTKACNNQADLAFVHYKRQVQKFLNIMHKVVIDGDRRKKENVKAKVFNLLKYNKLLNNKEIIEAKLNEHVPECKRLEQEIIVLEKSQTTKRKQSLLRATSIIFQRQMRYYLERWYGVIMNYKEILKRLKKTIAHRLKAKFKAALHLWQSKKNKAKTKEKEQVADSKAYEINNLIEENKTLKEDILIHETHIKNYTLSKLNNTTNKINRRYMRNNILIWKRIANYLRNAEIGIRKLGKIMKRHKLLNRFRKLKKQAKIISTRIGEEYKVRLVNTIVNKNLLRKMLHNLLRYKIRNKSLKSRIKKIFSMKYHKLINKALNKWKLNKDRTANLTLELHNEDISERIDETTNMIEEMQKRIRNVTETLSDIAKLDKKKSLISISKNILIQRYKDLKLSFGKWRDKTLKCKIFKRLLLRYLHKHTHNNLRATLHHWRQGMYVNSIEEVRSKLRRKTTKYITLMELSTLQLKENTEEHKQLKDIANKINNKLLVDQCKIDRTVNIMNKLKNYYIKHKANNNYLLAWIQMYKYEKALQTKVKNITQNYLGKHIYTRIKSKALKLKYIETSKKRLNRLLICLRKLYGRRLFKRWKREINLKRQETILSTYDNHEEALIAYNQILNTLKNKGITLCEQEILRRRKLKVFHGFIKVLIQERKLKNKAKELQERLRFMRLDKSFSQWRCDSFYLNLIKDKGMKANIHRDRVLKKSVIDKWKHIHKRIVTLPKALNRISKRQYLNRLGDGLEQLTLYNEKLVQYRRQENTNGYTRFLLITRGMICRQLGVYMSIMKLKCSTLQLDKELLRRIALKCLQRKLSSAISLWLQKTEEEKVVDRIEDVGSSATTALKIQRQCNSLSQIIYDCNLQHRFKQRNELNLSDLQHEYNPVHKLEKKFINTWIHKVKCKDLKNKYIMYWRKWLELRNNIRTSAKFIIRNLANKEKAWAWNKLKNLRRAAGRMYKRMPRADLIKRIVNSNKKVNLLNQEREVLEKSINNKQKKNDGMAKVYWKGIHLAAAVLEKYLKKLMEDAMRKWKLITQQLRIKDLNNILEMKAESFVKLRRIGVSLADRHNELLLENEELHRVSMNGIEIATVIQEITREREQLSLDLVDRSLTVKKLVEENRCLQQRLDAIKYENDKLLNLTKNIIT